MTSVISKYPLPTYAGTTEVRMPRGFELLSVHAHHDGSLSLWAIGNPVAEITPRTIEIVGAGFHVPDADRRYIGSAVLEAMMYHVFELIRQ